MYSGLMVWYGFSKSSQTPRARNWSVITSRFLAAKVRHSSMNRPIPNCSMSFLETKPSLLLDLDLDGKAMHVVPGPGDDVSSPHPGMPEDRCP